MSDNLEKIVSQEETGLNLNSEDKAKYRSGYSN